MPSILIQNGRVLTPDGLQTACDVWLRDGTIEAIGRHLTPPSGTQTLAADGHYLLPGFIEAHIHGCGGADFMDGTPEAFETIRHTAALHGTTALAVTTIACSEDALCALFALYRTQRARPCLAQLAGIHLEGPFLSQAMRGAQPSNQVRNPDPREIDALLDAAGDLIVRVSAAPELPGVRDMARKLTRQGILLSVAHSNATCEQVLASFDWGFTHITHLYSNTPSVRKIDQTVHAGVVEAAYLLDGMTVELIGDGKHVPKELMQTVVKLKGVERVLLVSDAMRAAGTQVRESYLGAQIPENRVIIEDGVAKLPDRTYYAGSIATADVMLRTAVQRYHFSLADASRMMSRNPARHLGLARKGSIAVGMDADVVLLDDALQVEQVFIGGQAVHAQRERA